MSVVHVQKPPRRAWLVRRFAVRSGAVTLPCIIDLAPILTGDKLLLLFATGQRMRAANSSVRFAPTSHARVSGRWERCFSECR